jgi:hypothetical protein
MRQGWCYNRVIPRHITDLEYDIYSAVVETLRNPERRSDLLLRKPLHEGPLVIHAKVQLAGTGDPDVLGLDGAGRVAHEDLIAKSLERSATGPRFLEAWLEPRLATMVPYHVDADDYFLRDPELFARYPNNIGVLFLSRVGFDSTQRVALLQLTFRVMALTSRSGFVQLVRRGGSWEIERETVTGHA